MPLASAAPTATLLERWYVLIMMCLVYTLSIADRYVVSTVLDPIRIELHLTDSGVALLTGFAFGLFYVVLGFPAVLAHRQHTTAARSSPCAWCCGRR